MDNNQKKVKLSKNGLIIIMVVLVFVLAIMLAIVIKNTKNEEKNEKEEPTTTVTTDDENAIVYDAKYKDDADVYGESYTDIYDFKYEYNIEVPYVNINGIDNSGINSEIKKLYDSFVGTYNECYSLSQNVTSNSLDSKSTCNISVNYNYTVYNDILSIMISKAYADDLGVYPSEYYTFNINTVTGTKMTYDEVLALNNLTRAQVVEKIMENYKTFAESNYSEEDYNKTLTAANNDQNIIYTSDGKISVFYDAYISSLNPDGFKPVVTLN